MCMFGYILFREFASPGYGNNNNNKSAEFMLHLQADKRVRW